jgi:hypothetical protein
MGAKSEISDNSNALPYALCSLLDAIGQKPINEIRPGVKAQTREKIMISIEIWCRNVGKHNYYIW